jgi:5-hydroxyisourate hydrolase-like protein (transthyretin family)
VFAGLAACWTGTDAPKRQTPPPDDKQVIDTSVQPTGAVAITGVVSDAATNSALPNVAVQLRDQNGQVSATNTDETGRYRFPAVAAGDYQLVFRYSAYDAQGSAQQPAQVRDVSEQIDVSLRLVRRAPVAKPYGAPPARRRTV